MNTGNIQYCTYQQRSCKMNILVTNITSDTVENGQSSWRPMEGTLSLANQGGRRWTACALGSLHPPSFHPPGPEAPLGRISPKVHSASYSVITFFYLPKFKIRISNSEKIVKLEKFRFLVWCGAEARQISCISTK